LSCVIGCGASAVIVGSASALEIGPVSVPTKVTVTVPPTASVGPVVVVTPKVVPKVLPKASVTTSPANGVGVDVSLPPDLGPVLPGLPNSVQVAVGPNGVGVVAPAPSVPGTPAGPAGASPTSPKNAAPRPRLSSAGPLPATPRSFASTPTGASGARAAAYNAGAARTAPSQDTADAVNASLQLRQPNHGWDLWRAAASARGLWIALLLIGLAASWIVHGFLRDAYTRARVLPGDA